MKYMVLAMGTTDTFFLICLKIHKMVIKIKLLMIPIISFSPSAHLCRRVLSCPALSILLSVHLSRPCYHSTAYNMQRILFIFHTVVGLSRSMNPMDYGISVFILLDSLVLWNFTNTLTGVWGGLSLTQPLLPLYSPQYQMNLDHISDSHYP